MRGREEGGERGGEEGGGGGEREREKGGGMMPLSSVDLNTIPLFNYYTLNTIYSASKPSAHLVAIRLN